MAADAPAAATESGKSRVAVLLALAAILTAVLGAHSELLASKAYDEWQGSGTLEVKRGAALLNDVSLVYLGDAPAAVGTLRARLRAEALREAAATGSFDVAQELQSEATVAAGLAQAESSAGGLAADAFRTGSFDIGRRLAAARAKSPDLVAIDPSEKVARADEASSKATLVLLASLPAALAFAAGAVAQARPRRRRPLLAAGVALLVVAALFAAAVEMLA